MPPYTLTIGEHRRGGLGDGAAQVRNELTPLVLTGQAADAVLSTLDESFRLTLTDFLHDTDAVRTIEVPEGEIVVGDELPGIGLNPMGSIAVADVVVDVGGHDQARWVRALSECGVFGPVPVPIDPAICRSRLEEFNQWRLAVTQAVAELIAEQTADKRRAARIQQLIVHRILRPSTQ